MHYFDNAATTLVHPQVAQTIADVMAVHFANPSSLYSFGMQAEDLIRRSRERVAAAMGFSGVLNQRRPEVIFTASGTEANNIAILGVARAARKWGAHIVATGYEHPGVAAPLAMLAQEGFALDIVPPGADGCVDAAQLAERVGAKTVLVCAMQVNNETGAVLDVAALSHAVKRNNPRTVFHVDGVQGFCKLPPALAGAQIDSYAVSGHKLHAPKGIGALYLRKNLLVQPTLAGGEQEGGRRPGTENTPYIAGFAKAVELAQQNRDAEQKTLRGLQDYLLKEFAHMQGFVRNSPMGAYPGILNVSFVGGPRSETLLHYLEQRDIYLSSGSACSQGKPSHTLFAMGLPPERIDTALRISPDGASTQKDMDALLQAVQDAMHKLARPGANSARR